MEIILQFWLLKKIGFTDKEAISKARTEKLRIVGLPGITGQIS
jgi:hypothetical protein